MEPVTATPIPAAWRRPVVWLVIQLVAVAVAITLLGGWQPQFNPDTKSYIVAGELPWKEALAVPRTLGYPLLLKANAAVTPDYGSIPLVHFSLLCATVLLFYAGIRRFGASTGGGLAISSALIYSSLPLRTQFSHILTDFSAMMFAVMAIALLFWLIADRRRIWVWLGVIVVVAAGYHTRPAYLFLIVLIPCLGVLLAILWAGWRRESVRWKRLFLGLTAGTVVPFLAYCLLRLVVVGNFGLISFGGHALSGLAAQLLDRDMVENDLSEEFRPLARTILTEREKRGMVNAFYAPGRVSMSLYESQYSQNIFHISMPAAKRIYDDDAVAYNARMGRFSREVLSLRKGKYLLWCIYYLPRAMAKAVVFNWSLWILLPVTLLLGLLRWWKSRKGKSYVPPAFVNQDRHVVTAMIWLASTYFLASISILCLSGAYADSRLVVPAGVFFPCLLAIVAVEEARKLFAMTHGATNEGECGAGVV